MVGETERGQCVWSMVGGRGGDMKEAEKINPSGLREGYWIFGWVWAIEEFQGGDWLDLLGEGPWSAWVQS